MPSLNPDRRGRADGQRTLAGGDQHAHLEWAFLCSSRWRAVGVRQLGRQGWRRMASSRLLRSNCASLAGARWGSGIAVMSGGCYLSFVTRDTPPSHAGLHSTSSSASYAWLGLYARASSGRGLHAVLGRIAGNSLLKSFLSRSSCLCVRSRSTHPAQGTVEALCGPRIRQEACVASRIDVLLLENGADAGWARRHLVACCRAAGRKASDSPADHVHDGSDPPRSCAV